jgi:hypothetical protein
MGSSSLRVASSKSTTASKIASYVQAAALSGPCDPTGYGHNAGRAPTKEGVKEIVMLD